MTPLPFSPFIDVALVDPENRFVLDKNALFAGMRAASDVWPIGDWPSWAKWSITNPLPNGAVPADDPPPLFLSDPSPDFLDAVYRELAPFIEQRARAA